MSRVPDVVECAGCKGRLDPRLYQGSPAKDAPRERITEIHAPMWPRFSVQCGTCGHYTLFIGEGPKRFD